jgi:hypothetical protein
MCQGSNCKVLHSVSQYVFCFFVRRGEKRLTNIIEAIRYNPSVAAIEITIFLKIWLVKREPGVSDPDATRFSMPLIASKKAETYSKDMSGTAL